MAIVTDQISAMDVALRRYADRYPVHILRRVAFLLLDVASTIERAQIQVAQALAALENPLLDERRVRVEIEQAKRAFRAIERRANRYNDAVKRIR